jgi:capsular exopolysaccharide synthesis family protein
MSQLFDALQRSEAERGEADLSRFSNATELLQLAEVRTRADWSKAAEFGQSGGNRSGENNHASPAKAEPNNAAVLDVPAVAGPSPDGNSSDPLSQFRSVDVSFPAGNRLVCITDSESLAAEKFRFLSIRLQHLRRDRSLKRVLITSTLPQEGKSTVSANLACTLARKKQQRILLVEGDVRRPSLSPLFGVGKLPGICQWHQGEPDIKKSVYHLDSLNLWFLPAGSSPSNPLDVLQSGKLASAMDRLAEIFDWVIIDSPPVMPLADTSVWMRWAEGILLVTRQGISEKQQLQRGLEAIESKKLIGAVLNGSRRSSRQDYYYPVPQN